MRCYRPDSLVEEKSSLLPQEALETILYFFFLMASSLENNRNPILS